MLALATGLAGCASTPEPVIGPTVMQPRADFGQQEYAAQPSRTYLLRASDKISVTVFREPDLSMEEVQIGVEGNISLPLVGSVSTVGMTAQQFEADLTRRFATAGLKSPMVSVNIVEYASHFVTVEGAVKKAGVFKFLPGSRLSSAIALAEGPDRVAKLEQVAVFRESPEGVMVAKFDYSQVRQGTMLDPILEPGDRVVVGTDGLSLFWQDALKTIPVLGIFGTIAVQSGN